MVSPIKVGPRQSAGDGGVNAPGLPDFQGENTQRGGVDADKTPPKPLTETGEIQQTIVLYYYIDKITAFASPFGWGVTPHVLSRSDNSPVRTAL